MLCRREKLNMDFETITTILKPSYDAGWSGSIAVFDRLDELSGLKLPAKIDFLLSILCEQGTLTLEYDTTSLQLTSRELMVLRPGHILHSYHASAGFRGHVIVVVPAMLGNTLTALSKVLPCFLKYKDTPVIKLTPDEIATQVALRSILRKKTSTREGHLYRDDVVRSILESLFYDTLGLYASYAPSRHPSEGMTRRDSLFHRFIKLVEENFYSERSLVFYAEKLGVTPKHLSASIKEASGHTAAEWIDSYVLIESKLMLRNTELSIGEISAKLNFQNQSFFGKYFKRLSGQSPRDYRAHPNS